MFISVDTVTITQFCPKAILKNLRKDAQGTRLTMINFNCETKNRQTKN